MNIKNQSNNQANRLDPADIAADSALQAMSTNMPLFLFRGLKKKHMDVLYTQGYYFYSQAKYKEALPLFRGLTFYNYLDQRGWLGAAGCYEMLKQYEQAITSYSFAAMIGFDDPIPALHSFDCYIALKQYPEALACLESVILLSSKKPEHATLKKRAELLRDALQKNIAENKKA